MAHMRQATGELVEITLENGETGGRLLCPQTLVPSPGQYLLAHNPDSDAPLALPIFQAGSSPDGFLIAPPIAEGWRPGMSLSLYGPLGRGFSLPPSSRCVALAALGETTARLKPLLSTALEQGAAVVLASDLDLPGLPPEVEIQRIAALPEVVRWADYLALDLPRESLAGLREMLGTGGWAGIKGETHPGPQSRSLWEALVLTPMPCGGMAECGVCAVSTHHRWKMACKDGPVFDLKELL